MGRSEGKRQLGRPRHGWEDYIKMGVQEVGWGVWTGMVWFRIGTGCGCCEYSNEPLGSIEYGEFLD